ncbi:circadian clock protein KaiB [bacterium]|nr:circadian clock protein KaiB [bacterium]
MTQISIIELRLYKAGNGPNSIRAVANALALCNEHNTGQQCRLEIVDILETPWRALQDGVLVTPTLLRISPKPTVRVIGDLSERAHVLVALNMG